jgi:hypothetical protein
MPGAEFAMRKPLAGFAMARWVHFAQMKCWRSVPPTIQPMKERAWYVSSCQLPPVEQGNSPGCNGGYESQVNTEYRWQSFINDLLTQVINIADFFTIFQLFPITNDEIIR